MSVNIMVSGKLMLLLCCILVEIIGSVNRRSGPYDWVMEKLERCPDSGTDESVFPTKLTKVNRNQAVLNDTFRLAPSIDEDSKVEIEAQEWGNQGYRPRSFLIRFKKCSKIWKESSTNLKKMFESTGFPLTGCPIPAGNYSSENIVLDFKLAKVPVMVYNKYRIVISLYHGERKVGCGRFYGEMVPKE